MSPENAKPEWFQMADADATPAAPKSKKGIRLMALATPLLVLGAGLAYAQTQGTSPADAGTAAQASTNTILLASSAASISTSTPEASTPPSTTPVASTHSTSERSTPVVRTVSVSENTSTVTPTATPSQPAAPVSSDTPTPPIPSTAPATITKPGLTMPTGGGEDDGQEHHQHKSHDGQVVRTSDDD